MENNWKNPSLIVPCHLSEFKHWLVLKIRTVDRKIMISILDSLECSITNNYLRTKLNESLEEYHKTIEICDPKFTLEIESMRCPQQRSTFDCGDFTIVNLMGCCVDEVLDIPSDLDFRNYLTEALEKTD